MLPTPGAHPTGAAPPHSMIDVKTRHGDVAGSHVDHQRDETAAGVETAAGGSAGVEASQTVGQHCVADVGGQPLPP